MTKQPTLKQKVLNQKGRRKKIHRGLHKLIDGLIELSKENEFYNKVPFQNKLLAYNAYLNLAEENGLSKDKYQDYFANNF